MPIEADETRKKWAVIGGGMLGLSTAWRLMQRVQEVTVFEASPTVGGLTSSWRISDVTWDRFYHVTLLSDLYLRGLLKELELDENIDWVQTRTGFYSGGKLHSLSSSLDFLRFPILSLYEKFRLGGTIFFGSKLRNWRALEKIPVENWLRRWSGNSTFEKIWQPLLKCKLGDAYQRTNAAFIWAYIQRMYAARRSGMKREMFGYVIGGYDRTLDAFANHLTRHSVQLRTSTKVTKISKSLDSSDWQIQYENSNGSLTEGFDRVVTTVPSPTILKTVDGLSDNEVRLLSRTEYLGVVCTSLLISKPLGGYYVTNITDPDIPLTGVIEMGSILKPERLGGHYLIYLPKYVLANDPAMDEPSEAIHERCLATLERMYPHFERTDVRAIQTAKARYVMALPTLNYSEQRCPIVAEQPGLFLLNSARIVDGTLNVNEILRLVDTELLNSIWPAHEKSLEKPKLPLRAS